LFACTVHSSAEGISNKAMHGDPAKRDARTQTFY